MLERAFLTFYDFDTEVAGEATECMMLDGATSVDVHEQTNVRHTDPADFGGPGGLVVTDLSFISLRVVAPHLVAFAADDADLVILVKPQFEAGKAEVDKVRGVIRDPVVWRRTLDDATTALSAAGAAIMGVMVSPITGGDGNVEFLVHARAGAPDVDQVSWAQWRDAAVAAAFA